MDLEDILREIKTDTGGERAEEKRHQYLSQIRDILSRATGPTDIEVLKLISDLFHDVCQVTPFSKEYDFLIERLSFTVRDFESVDGEGLKTAWTRFLNGLQVEFTWPLNVGMAGWYSERSKVAHAIAVYEHLYSLIRRGGLHEECPDMFEAWLTDLLNVCCARLPQRAKHLCDVIEDFYYDGYISFEKYVETIPIRSALRHVESRCEIESDRQAIEKKLECEYVLLSGLHPVTRKLIVEAELWSTDRWKQIQPTTVPLNWALVIESEFDYKVFKPGSSLLRKILADKAPRGDQVCGLAQIIKIIAEASRNVGVKTIFARRRHPEFLASSLGKLNVVLDHRNRAVHARGFYAVGECCAVLQEIREDSWIFNFLEALQPIDDSVHN